MAALLQRVKAILVAPAAEWQAIASEPADGLGLFVHYVAVLALIPALARFIGWTLIGNYTPVVTGLIGAAVGYVLAVVAVYLVALVINGLAARFGAQKGLSNALKLAAYSYTPAWLAGIFLLVPGLSFLTVLGLYGVYLVRSGLPPLMRVPPEATLPYAAAVGGCAIMLAIMLGIIQVAVFSAPK